MSALRIEFPEALIEAIAMRTAALVIEQLAGTSTRPEPSRYLTIEEAAEYLRCKRQAVDDLLSRGKLARVKLGRRTLIERAEIEAHLARETSRRSR